MHVSLICIVVFSLLCDILGKISNILVIGGSGRVGGSAVRSLLPHYGVSNVFAGGRSQSNWNDYIKKYPTCNLVEFVPVDYNDEANLRRTIQKFDIFVNTAGPFQGLLNSPVLQTSLNEGKKYIDVCDDIKLSRIVRSKLYKDLATENGGIAIISTGIWPGASSLLAKELIQRVGGSNEVEKVSFSFFTAGSGGAGPTILTATFLILGEEVLVYKDGKPVYYKPATDKETAYFGETVGSRDIVRLNLIECESCFCTTRIKNVETRFGTAPPLWNSLFGLMANIPAVVLKNRQAMTFLGQLSLPLVRLVDNLVGSANGIRVDVETKRKGNHHAILVHNDMEKAVGDSLAAFVREIDSNNKILPGVYFPEELNDEFGSNVLKEVSKTASEYFYSNI